MKAAVPELDSLNSIARDAAGYAEGAGEPEFSQFLKLEARLLALVRVKASLGPYTDALADAVVDLLETMEMQEKRESGEYHIISEVALGLWRDSQARARVALRLAGRLP